MVILASTHAGTSMFYNILSETEDSSMDSIIRIGKESLLAMQSPVNLVSLIGIWLAYRVALALYNISPFHPLYKFPGPRLAAIGYFYEGYYDFWLGGRYGHEIRRMHKVYGVSPTFFPLPVQCTDKTCKT